MDATVVSQRKREVSGRNRFLRQHLRAVRSGRPSTSRPIRDIVTNRYTSFCYDEQNRLVWASSNGNTGKPTSCTVSVTPGTLTAAQYNQSFAYDNLGRLTSGPLGSYMYGNSGHLHGATAIGTSYTASYDAAGNMNCRAPSNASSCSSAPQTAAQMSYDPEGALSAWQNVPTSPTSTASFLYDNQGNRVEQVATQNGSTTTTVYVGNLEEVATNTGGTTVTTFYYAQGKRIALAVNGAFSYLASDGLGSANVALNSSGSSTAATLYAPYGGVRYSTQTAMPTDYGFTGQHSDSLTGLDYYIARYYDPVASQFTSADSILPGDGLDAFGLSRYAYVEGNPILRTDGSGHISIGQWCLQNPVGCTGGSSGSASTSTTTTATLTGSGGPPPTHKPKTIDFGAGGSPDDLKPRGCMDAMAIGTLPCSPQFNLNLNPACFTVEGFACAIFNPNDPFVRQASQFIGPGATSADADASYARLTAASDYAESPQAARALSRELAKNEAGSAFDESGALKPEVIAGSKRIIEGSELGNTAVVRVLTANGTNLEDWGKYQTRGFRRPNGTFTVHFYYNPVTQEVNYTIDYKVILGGAS